MKKQRLHIFLLIPIILFIVGCSYFTKDSETYTVFADKFSGHWLEPEKADTIICSSMTFGDHENQPYSTSRIPFSMFRDAVGTELIKEAVLIDSSYSPYILGRFFITDKVEAFMTGAYHDLQDYSSHLFLYNRSAKKFIGTQALDYTIGGGGFLSKRYSWITDLNNDQMLDVVYYATEINNDGSGSNTYDRDTIYAEVWKDNHFVPFSVKEDANAWRETIREGAGLINTVIEGNNMEKMEKDFDFDDEFGI